MPSTQAHASLPEGTTLAQGRYHVDKHLRDTAFGPMVQATDTSTGTPVSIQLLSDELKSKPKYIEALQTFAARASAIEHKNVARILDVEVGDGQAFVVCEFLDGHPLIDLLERKRAEGLSFSPKQVSNITAHLCAAVEACAAIGGHGAVSLESVMVNKAGRVKLAGLGLGILAPAVRNELGPRLSPETHTGAPPSSQSDVYGVGAVVYELLVGSPPQKGCQRPSVAVPGLSTLVDQFVGSTTNPDPAQRPSVAQLGPAALRALSTPSAEHAPQTGEQAAVVSKPARPSLAQAITTPEAEQAPRVTANHSAALGQALAETRERWLITKGKLDYGPYSLANIVEQINSNQILPGNLLVDNDTGTRVKVENHPLLGDLVDAAKEKRDHERRANAEVVHAKQERSRGAALYIIVAAAILGLGGGAYFIVKALGKDKATSETKLAGLGEGSLEAKISFPSVEQAEKRRSKNRSHKGSKASQGTGGGWDESLDLDMAGADGGDERLSASQVNPVIQRSGGALGRCLSSTKTSDAFIEFMVKGTGKVYQVRVNGSSDSAIANCVRKVMFSMNFPSFNGVRSKHNFDMSF